MTRSATPAEEAQYVTPPRFSRSATPTSSLRGEVGDYSPLSGRGSGLDSSLRGSSPFGSPLGGGSERRKLSYTSSSARNSPLSVSEFEAVGGGSLATPTKGSKATLGLNNKWLYEKGRGSPSVSLRGSPGRVGGFS
jgi:nucleoporin POM34